MATLWKSFLAAWLAMLVCTAPLLAHEMTPAEARLHITQDQLELSLTLPAEALVAGIDLSSVRNTNLAPQAADYDRLRAMNAKAFHALLIAQQDKIADSLWIEAEGVRIQPKLAFAEVATTPDPDLTRLTILHLAADLPPGTAPVVIAFDKTLGEVLLRQTGTVSDYAVLLAPGQFSAPLPRNQIARESPGANLWRYLKLGFGHILPKGLDHILFVLGLFFLSPRLRPLLYQVSAFTLAHSLTLALASLGWIGLPQAVTNPLIAASIVFVAAENLTVQHLTRTRLALVFGFGLVHGLGFASALQGLSNGVGGFLASLVSFNLGVEAGQLTILAIAWFGLGIWIADSWLTWQRSRTFFSGLIGLIGTFWLLRELFF